MDDIGPYTERELRDAAEGEFFGANLAVVDRGETVADLSFDFYGSEEACAENLRRLTSGAKAMDAALREHAGIGLAPGFSVEVSAEHVTVASGGIDGSEFEPWGIWHVGADGEFDDMG